MGDQTQTGPPVRDISFELDALHGAALTVFDGHLLVREALGSDGGRGRFRPESLVGLTLAEAFAIADVGALEAACRHALAGGERVISCASPHRGLRYLVKLAPSSGSVGMGVALWVEMGDLGRHPDGSGDGDQELRDLWLATRSLGRAESHSEVRAAVCESARRVSRGSVAILFEPTADGAGLEQTASTDSDCEGLRLPLDELSGATLAMRTGSRQTTAAGDPQPPGAAAMVERCGLAAILWHPISRGRVVNAVVAVGFPPGGPRPGERESRVLETLAVEAAVALERERRAERIQRDANTDVVTGLPNRRFWNESLGREMARAKRLGEPLCIAMVDLDAFKAYNDANGHPAGDALLASLATAWKPTLRATDALIRFGGDEFAVLLPDCDIEGGASILRRMLDAGGYGFSCGIAGSDGGGEPELLVDRADRALYRAKQAGAGSISL